MKIATHEGVRVELGSWSSLAKFPPTNNVQVSDVSIVTMSQCSGLALTVHVGACSAHASAYWQRKMNALAKRVRARARKYLVVCMP